MPDKRKAIDKSSDKSPGKSSKDKPDKEKRPKNPAGKTPAPEQQVGDTPTPPWEMPSPEQKAEAKPVRSALRDALSEVDSPEKADAIVDEFERFIADGPTTAEVDRVKAQYEREWLGELARFDNRADLFSSYATLQGDPEAVNRRLDEIRAVTIDDVAAAASDWLAADQRAVVTYHRERA